jgi:abnormal spindle-like microcephaly-associated protein
VLLLDTVNSQEQLPRHAPLLFRIDASIKSSAQAVQAFTHQRLQGEGNVLRHLELLGYRLAYTQSPLTE